MVPARWIACAALLLPASSALAQTVYYERVYRDPAILTRDELRTCMARERVLDERSQRNADERAQNDREAADIAREGAALAEELRRVDAANTAAVASYNARSAAHNARVEAHNRRVAEANGRVASLNNDNVSLDALCARPFLPSDRDAILAGR